jgi:hypothetical protein
MPDIEPERPGCRLRRTYDARAQKVAALRDAVVQELELDRSGVTFKQCVEGSLR